MSNSRSVTSFSRGRPPAPGEPAWDIAYLFPPQGEWSEKEFLALHSSRLVELSEGFLEVLPMPTVLHQLIVKLLHARLDAFVSAHGLGTVLFAPLPVRLSPRKFREPDVVFLRPGRFRSVRGQPDGADLVIEVVSEGDEGRERDLEVKPKEYAEAGIPEFWIVDPQAGKITVLVLDSGRYREHGSFRRGETAASVLLPGFDVPVTEVLAPAADLT